MLIQSHDPCYLPSRSAAPRESTPKTRAPLSDMALALMSKPQVNARLSETGRCFPHVVNRLAEDWMEPDTLLARIDAMLLNDRPNRQGFPLAVVQELSELRAYYVEQAAPQLRQLQIARTRVPTATPRRSPGSHRKPGGSFGLLRRILGADRRG